MTTEDIEVQVVCQLPENDDTYTVTTADRNTVAGLIRQVCREHRIPMKTSYTMHDKRDRVMQWSQTLVSCGVKNNDTLYLTNEDDDVHVQSGCSWNSWWFVAAICLLIGGVGITAITILYTRNGAPQLQYGVVLDAGSSHTKLFVYSWDGERTRETAQAQQIHTCTVNDHGITSYASNPSNLSGPLNACLDEAKTHVPYDARSTTPVFLGATAGMRMLNEVDSKASDLILLQVRDTLQGTPFSFTSPNSMARIISGQEEGTFGWITANYISGHLAVSPDLSVLSAVASPESTIGALDMGGASTQITFYTHGNETIPPEYKEDLNLYEQNYSVYTHSYLCYGINEAIRKYEAKLVMSQGYNETNITNPCGPSGNVMELSSKDIFEAPCVNRYTNEFASIQQYRDTFNVTNYTFIGTSDEEECISTVKSLFNFSKQCPREPCTFNGTFQPPVKGEFYAFSSFFYEMSFLNLTRNSSLEKFTDKLSVLCNSSWKEVSKMPAGDNGTMLPWYCFEGHFIRTLLVDAYKFDNQSWNNIHFIKKINKTEVGWTLGYMLNSSNTIPPKGPEDFISTPVFSVLTALFVIFILLSVAFVCYARKYQQQQKAQGLYGRLPTYGAV